MITLTERHPIGNREVGFSEFSHAVQFAVSQLKQAATLRISSLYPDFKQRNAAMTLATGGDTDLMSLSEAQELMAGLTGIVEEVRGLESAVLTVAAGTGTDAEKAAAINAIWFVEA